MGASGAGRREVADWIRTVGVGVMFTRHELDAAFPGVKQIDRRFRELRECGWAITTNRQDKNLRPGQYRCDRFGGLTRKRGPSDFTRRATIERDHRQCQVCGVIAGQPYPDDSHARAFMYVERVDSTWETRCARCHGAESENPADDDARVTAAINSLTREEKETIFAWMSLGRRPLDSAEVLFAEVSSLPTRERDEIAAALRGQLAVSTTRP